MRTDGAAFDLRTWLPEAIEFEPAHGHLIRLAADYQFHSGRVFADAVGLNGRDFNIPELLNFCLQFPMRNKEALVRATPVFEGSFVAINGQKVRKRTQWSISQPRVCVGCLGEGRYYRNWWDITVIGRCPIHDRPLIDGDGDSKLSWWCADIGLTRSGRYVGVHVPRVDGQPYLSWDTYALGRMGVISSPVVQVLDDAELYAVAESAELIGRAIASGWKTHSPPMPKVHSEARYAAVARGFLVLRDGREGIEAFLAAFMRNKPSQRTSTKAAYGFDGFFGWLSKACDVLEPNPVSRMINGALLDYAGRAGVHPRKRERWIQFAQLNELNDDSNCYDRPVNLNELAHGLRITPAKVRELANKLGLLHLSSDRTKPHLFGKEEVQNVKAMLTSFVPHKEVAALLGISRSDLNVLCDNKVISPFMRLGGPGDLHLQFLRSDIDALIERAKQKVTGSISNYTDVTISEFCRLSGKKLATVLIEVLAGKGPVNGWDELSLGLKSLRLSAPPAWTNANIKSRKNRGRSVLPGVSYFDASALLNVPPPTIARLVEADHLPLVNDSKIRNRKRIDEQALLDFKETYAPAKIYTEILGCPADRAYPKLREMGVARLQAGKTFCEGSFVERAHVRNVLGLSVDPDDRSDGEFWSGLKTYLEAKRSTNRLLRIESETSAEMNSGNRKAGAQVVLDLQIHTVQFVVEVLRKKSPLKYDTIARHQKRILAALPGCEVLNDTSSARLRLVDTLSLGCVDDMMSPEVYGWIDSRMTVFRQIMTEGLAAARSSGPNLVSGGVLHRATGPDSVADSSVTAECGVR